MNEPFWMPRQRQGRAAHVVAIASTLLYLRWADLEVVPGFRIWLALVVTVGIFVPVSNVVLFAIEMA